jgi:hypothetical protein
MSIVELFDCLEIEEFRDLVSFFSLSPSPNTQQPKQLKLNIEQGLTNVEQPVTSNKNPPTFVLIFYLCSLSNPFLELCINQRSFVLLM